MIREFAGKDGTKGFTEVGHSSDAKNLMKKFKIGELDEVNIRLNRWKINFQKQKGEQKFKTSLIKYFLLGLQREYKNQGNQ